MTHHLVHLYDEPESRADAVADFLYNGWTAGAPLLIVARPTYWLMISARLEARGCPVADAIVRGRIVVLDAAITLAAVMVGGQPEAQRFDETVGVAVRRLSEQHGQPCIYGAMVDILASEGRFDAAQQLEAMWNALGTRCRFTLLCGYSSAHFTDPLSAAALKHICDLHTESSAPPNDLLARWLLSERRPRVELS